MSGLLERPARRAPWCPRRAACRRSPKPAYQLDALVASARDPGEQYSPGDLDPPPRHVVRTAGAAGGEYETLGGETGRWAAAELPGPISDAYGCGDSFAAGLTYGLGTGLSIGEAAELAAPLRRRLPHGPRALRGPAAQLGWPRPS